MKIQIRSPKDGRWIRGTADKAKKSFRDFGNHIVSEGKSILRQKGKRASGTLASDFKSKFVTTRSGMELTFDFGGAKDYWRFIDQGVRGTGGAKKGRTKKGEQSSRGGTGIARGAGSPYRFKYDNPAGDLVTALKSWIRSKSISLKDNMNVTQTAFAMGYSIKRRGLERTLFFTKPYEKLIKKGEKAVAEAYAKDVENLIAKIPKVIGTHRVRL